MLLGFEARPGRVHLSPCRAKPRPSRLTWPRCLKTAARQKLDDLPLEVIGEAVRRVPAKKYIEFYESSIRTMNKRASKKSTVKAR
jgi:hypothetical protein